MKRKEGKTAVIFFGNSTASAFDVGVAKILFKKVKPDFIMATSMGSVNASLFLRDKEYLKNIKYAEKLWKLTDARKIFKLNPQLFYKFIFAKSIFSNTELKKILNILDFGKRKIEDSPIPLYIGAYDVTNRKTVFFYEGCLLEAVMASCSAPLYFPPYNIRGTEYVDGSINGRACLDKAIELGATRIFLINVASKKREARNIFSSYRKNISIMKTASIEHLLDSKIKDYLINISPEYDLLPCKFTDMKNTGKLIKHGEQKAREIFNKIKI